MTVIFPVYGQGDPSALDLPNDWHPRTPYLYNPYKSDQPSLVMPYDSSTYSPRGLIRLPFFIVRSTQISKDWSTISLAGKLIGKSYKTVSQEINEEDVVFFSKTTKQEDEIFFNKKVATFPLLKSCNFYKINCKN